MKFTILVHPSMVINTIYIFSLSDQCLGEQRKRYFKEIMHFHYMTYMATPQHKNPDPGGHEIYNFGRPFLGHHYYILGLSDLCLGVEKKIVKEIMQIQYMTPMAMPQHKNPSPRCHEIYTILVDPTWSSYFVCLINAREQRRRFFKKYSNFTLFTPKLPSLWVGGHEIYNFLSPYPRDATYQIWLRLALQFLRRRC